MLSFQLQKKSVEFVRLSRLYGSFRGDDAVLAPYPTLAALLDGLEATRRAGPGTRARFLCAVIARHRVAPGPLGAAIVLHAFRGMLGKLSKGLVGIEREDADALVAWALVEALRRVRPAHDPARIAMYVRQETRRVLFAALARDARARPYALIDEDDEGEGAEVQEHHGTDLPPVEEAHDDRPDAPDDERDDAEAVPDDEDEEHPAAPESEWAPDQDGLDMTAARPRWRSVDPDTLVDPASRVPIEERLDLQAATANRVCDDDLLRAHAVRGGLRRLTRCLLADASARQREHMYRQLLRRAHQLVARRK